MISVLFPTRGRPYELGRTVDSCRATAKTQVEIVVYIDNDDKGSVARAKELGIKYLVGPRILLTKTWNELAKIATGDIFMQANDDIIFRTPGWDIEVLKAYAESQDKILMVHGSDGGGFNGDFGPHPFVHRRWVETIGYFIAPYFSSDYGDTWLNDVANILGRRKYIPFVVEHMHFSYGKAGMDQTTRDRLQRHNRDNPTKTYESLAIKRSEDAVKLGRVMNTPSKYDTPVKWSILILTQPSRKEYLKRLRNNLDPQVYRAKGVDIDVRLFDTALSLGTNRQLMREAAKGEYSCFIDDDDVVASDYVAKILPLLDGVDYVGFRLQCYIDGVPLQPTYHSLKHVTWYSDSNGHYRDISHVNPIKNKIALKATMAGGFGEDSRWSDDLRKLNIVKTEHYVSDVMYHYYVRSVKEDATFVFQPKPQEIVYKEPPLPSDTPVCPDPKCNSICVVIFSNGWRCNQCGLQF